MPIPAGFKVNGDGTRKVLTPPRVQKIMAMLDKAPSGELFTSNEIAARIGLSIGGSWCSHPALADYKERIDNKLYWGSPKSIKRLRDQLAETEESNG